MLNYKTKEKEEKLFDEIREWLEKHEHEMPRYGISVNGKQLRPSEMTKEQKHEIHLYSNWENSKICEAYEICMGLDLKELPEEYAEYRDVIAVLREHEQKRLEKFYQPITADWDKMNLLDMPKKERRALIKANKRFEDRENKAYAELIKWLDSHDGKMPRITITVNGKMLKAKDMTEQQRYEVDLRTRWEKTITSKVFKSYGEKPLEELPEEYLKYKDRVTRLNWYKQKADRENLSTDDKTFLEYIEWLDEHHGKPPKDYAQENKVRLKSAEMTDEQRKEINLSQRWKKTEIHKALEECKGIPLSELPKEYEKYKKKIEELRAYGLGKTVYEEMIEYLEHQNNGKSNVNDKEKSTSRIKKEQRQRKSLREKWRTSKEYEVLKACTGIPLDEIPKEYEEYRAKIAKLRSYGLGLEKKSLFDEYVEWLENHEARPPQSTFSKNGKHLKTEELSPEQLAARRLNRRLYASKFYKAMKACEGMSLDAIPEEYEKYKDEIKTMRDYQERRKAIVAKRLMKKSVGKRVRNNAKTREMLSSISKEAEIEQR